MIMTKKFSAEEVEATRRIYIPKNATPIQDPNGLGVVYVYADSRNRFGVMAFSGNRRKYDFHYAIKEEALLDKTIAEYFANLAEAKQRRMNSRAARSAGHTFKVGEIIYNTWGYSMTMVDFYVVVKTTKNFVWLQELQQTVDENTEYLAGRVAPKLDDSLLPVATNKAVEQRHAEGDRVNMEFGSGQRYTGGTVRFNHCD